MDHSILNSTKKILGIDASYDAFDTDILVHINSVFSTLNELGIGPDEGFMIEDASATWDTFLGTDFRLNHIRSYVWLRVKLLFDPPSTSFAIESMNRQIEQLEWRINVQREAEAWTDPTLSSS